MIVDLRSSLRNVTNNTMCISRLVFGESWPKQGSDVVKSGLSPSPSFKGIHSLSRPRQKKRVFLLATNSIHPPSFPQSVKGEQIQQGVQSKIPQTTPAGQQEQ
jgi:hypothetical protein